MSSSGVSTSESSVPWVGEAHPWIASRADSYLNEQNANLWRRTDRAFAVLMLLQWVFAVAMVAIFTPTTWTGENWEWHPHLKAALVLGGWLTALPTYLAWRHAGEATTRHTIAVAQALWSALLIHLSGGRIETHFHVFGSLAFLSVYRDWRLLMTNTVVMTLDHTIRAVLCPESVYGESAFALERTVEHVGWMVFEDVFLIGSCLKAVRQSRLTARQHAELEASHAIVSAEVARQTEELRLREQQARSLVIEAESANRSKSQFLANMSHEIRTPMTAILGFADLLLEDLDVQKSSEARADAITTIRRNGQHLLTIINDILDLSKIESGNLAIELLTCNPVQMLDEIGHLLQSRASEKGLRLRLTCEGKIPREVCTDTTRLRQILINVVGNAIKFTERGGIQVKMRMNPDDHEELLFDIVDSGIGMTREHQERLFRPFMQGDESMARRFGGTGLGLVISKHLANLLGGDLQIVTSAPGAGTTMQLSVRIGTIAPDMFVTLDEARVENEPANPVETAAPGEGALTGLKILLAEDFVENQRMISYVLRKAGAAVIAVGNGEQAVAAIDEQWQAAVPFDVVLMDMQMPVLDGYEATARLRADGYSGTIVALTAHVMEGERDRCLRVGCNDYVSKPIDRRRLIETVNRLARRGPCVRHELLATS